MSSVEMRTRPDAHAGAQRDGEDGIRLALEARERRARVRVGVDEDAEPGDPVASEDTDDAEQDDDRDAHRVEAAQRAEVRDHDRADEDLQKHEELALGDEVGLASLVDELGDVGHRFVDRQVANALEHHHAEGQSGQAYDDSGHQQRAPGHAVEADGAEVGHDEIRLTGRGRAGRKNQQGPGRQTGAQTGSSTRYTFNDAHFILRGRGPHPRRAHQSG
jgi:hypothetical protein